MLRRPGEDLGGLALALLAGEVLAGNGETSREARACFEKAGGFMNAFDQADASLRSAVRNFSWAAQEQTPQDRAECYQTAFGKLFHAARIAALCYLGRDTGAWGGLPRVLPPPFGQQFRDMVASLHTRFGYEGRIPEGGEAAEFEAWRQRVEAFVAAMRRLVAGRGGSAAGHRGPPEPGLPPEPAER